MRTNVTRMDGRAHPRTLMLQARETCEEDTMTDARQKAREEMQHLRDVTLPAAIRALEEANSQGDASQNPDSFIASEEISRINGRIAYLAELAERDDEHPLAAGTVVVLDYGDGPEEHVMSAAPGGDGGRVAITFRSPLGAALATALPGDRLSIGKTQVKVVTIIRPDTT